MANQSISCRAHVAAGMCALALAFAACAPQRAVEVQPAPVATLTDANVASIMLSADQAEIERGRLALSRTQNATVRQFAQQMVDDHTRMMQQVQAVTTQRRIAPVAAQTTREIETMNAQTLSTLQAYNSTDFDRQYIATEIANHQWLLDALDNSLIPGTQDSELRGLLMEQRAVVTSHLRRAQEIQASIGRPQQR